MKAKVEIGQCYEKGDRVFEVINLFGKKAVYLRDVITKQTSLIGKQELKTWRRPFQNFG